MPRSHPAIPLPLNEWHREWWSDKTLINCIFHMNDLPFRRITPLELCQCYSLLESIRVFVHSVFFGCIMQGHHSTENGNRIALIRFAIQTCKHISGSQTHFYPAREPSDSTLGIRVDYCALLIPTLYCSTSEGIELPYVDRNCHFSRLNNKSIHGILLHVKSNNPSHRWYSRKSI